MTKGPNSFFVAPDSDMIIEGTIYSSSDPTGLYTTTCLASSANSGSMSAFMIGTPSSNTTYQMKVQDSGSNGTGTFIQRLSTATGSDSTLVWHGEPDRRHIWDVHNPLLKNYSSFFSYSSTSTPANYFWEDSLSNDSATNIRGVYSSALDKEFIYVSRFENNMPRLYVASRSIANYESSWTKEAEITTLSMHNLYVYNLSAVDSNKRGIQDAYEPTFSVCEHIDKKIRLAVKFNEDVDIYESSDGVNFTLVAKNILSRFIGKRFISDMKIASSGPYLKIVFVVGKITGNSKRWMGGIVSSDGGATWDYTDVAESVEDGGAGISIYLVGGTSGNMNYNYDLCGLSDGSGKFILAASGTIMEEGGSIGAQSESQISQGTAYPGYVKFWASSANSPFSRKLQMGVPNILQSGKVFIASGSDWVWMIVAGSYNPIDCNWFFMNPPSGNWPGSGLFNAKPCDTYYANANGISPGTISLENTRENAMFYLPIDADLELDQWIPLGNTTREPNSFEATNIQRITQKSGRTTGALGSYFYYPSGGNLYECGSYMAFCSLSQSSNPVSEAELNWTEYLDGGGGYKVSGNEVADKVTTQYYRFSGWLIRPPYINLGMNAIQNPEFHLKSVKAFVHQENAVISAPEFNYIWGKPCGDAIDGNQIMQGSIWSFRKKGFAIWDKLADDGLHFIEANSAPVAYQSAFYYFRCPVVANSTTWSSGSGQAYSSVQASDIRYPMFPHTMVAVGAPTSPTYSWCQRPNNYGATLSPPGSCIQFVFGGVSNGSDSRNSIGIKINSFTRGDSVPNGITSDVFIYEYFLRMDQTTLKLYNTSASAVTEYYRETSNVLLTSVTISGGGTNFSDGWWEGRISFLPDTDSLQNRINVVVSVRQLGTETWTDSVIYSELARFVGQGYASGTDGANYLGIQGVSFGLFPDSASTQNRKVAFRSLKVCQGSDMTHLQMILNNSNTNFPPEENLIRGRTFSPNPTYIGTGQSISWGGIGGKFGDLFDSKIKSSYEAKNTIKVSSPRFEYRTKGDNADIKLSKAEIIYQLPNDERTASSLSGYALFHTGLGLINTNAGKIKIEYSDSSAFGSPYTIGTKSLVLKNARITAASNNRITATIDGASSSLNSNTTEYTSTDSGTYYCKFTQLGSGSLPSSLLEKSYKITKSSGNHFVLNLTDRDFSDGSYSSIAGTSISIYSDRMVSRYTTIPSQNKYMKVTLMCHLGTTDYFKLGSMVAGITFGMQRVPINWTHSVNVNSNTTEFNSRSGVRWAYKEGPSVRTFTGEIEGDVFDEERENIKNIAEQATRFNSYPVAWVFDGDTGENFSPVGDDATAKVHINPKNILYGTINNSLQLANEGWRYDSDNSEWKVVGDLQLTVIEVV